MIFFARRSALLLCGVCTACSAAHSPAGERGQAQSLSIDRLRCGGESADHRCSVYDVSLYELLANPATFHAKRVRVIGFAHFEFEGNGLYAHREDWERGVTRNGLWLSPPSGSDSLSNHYVLVEGRFDATSRGHMGMWSGTLDSVTRLQRWEVPRDRARVDTSGMPRLKLP